MKFSEVLIKVCVTAGASGLDAPMDPALAEEEVVEDNEDLPTETIFAEGVQVPILGGLGPKAVSAFSQAGIDVFVGATGIVKDAIENWQPDMLTGADLDNACQDHKH